LFKRKFKIDFLVIGSQKCGTTSLYNYIVEHPDVIAPLTKELRFFDLNFSKGPEWYAGHFPPIQFSIFNRQIKGEGTPYYIFHPRVPERVYYHFPKVKLIALLRNPIDRAYSHYNGRLRNGYENLSFEEAIEKEEERLKGEIDKIKTIDDYYSYNHQNFSYLSRGIYYEQIKQWLKFFPRKQLLIICSEEFFSNPSATYKRVIAHLGLRDFSLNEFNHYNEAKYAPMDEHMRSKLQEYFEPSNKLLFSLIGENYEW